MSDYLSIFTRVDDQSNTTPLYKLRKGFNNNNNNNNKRTLKQWQEKDKLQYVVCDSSHSICVLTLTETHRIHSVLIQITTQAC